MVLENKEIPSCFLSNSFSFCEYRERLQMKIKEMVSSPFTRQDAVRYLTKLALYKHSKKSPQTSTADNNEAEGKEIDNENKKIKDNKELEDVNQEQRDGGHQMEKKAEDVKRIPILSTDSKKISEEVLSKAIQESISKSQRNSKDSQATKTKKKPTQNANKKNLEKTDDSNLEDLDPELIKILNEAAEAIKKNQTPVMRQLPTKVRKTPQQMKEEEIKRRFPGSRPWPTLEECREKPLPKTLVFTSTWLSVTAKGVNVKDHINYKTSLDHYPKLPYCHNDFPLSRKTLNHLTGMNGHPLVQYKAEKGLQEVLCTLDGYKRTLDEMATRVKLAMDKNSTSWVLSNMAALYRKIVGQGQLAIQCLKHALYYSNSDVRDVALVSLANVLYRIGYDMDAMAVIHMSLEVGFSSTSAPTVEASPSLVVTHFTMANMLAAQGFFSEAAGFYESTLQYQPEFQPASDRLKTARCLILVARHRKDKERDKIP